MLSRPNLGAESEERFITVCKKKTAYTPHWMGRIKRAGIGWDMRGVDAFAYFVPIEDPKRVKVPIQIKSSNTGRKLFKIEKSPFTVENVVVIVVNSRKSDDSIRQQLYSELGKLRRQRRRFDEFLIKTTKDWMP